MESTAQARYRAGMDRIFMRPKGDPSNIDLRDSEADFRAAIRLDPAFVEAYFQLAVLLEVRGQREDAIELLRGGIAAAPCSGRLYGYLSAILMRDRQLGEAEGVVRNGITIDPASPALRLALGLCLWRRGDADGAREACGEALRLCPGFAGVRSLVQVIELEEQVAAGATGTDIDFNLGKLYAALHEPQSAVERLTRVPISDSRYTMAQLSLCFCWGALGREKDSLDAARAVVCSQPGHLAWRRLFIAKLKGRVDLGEEMEREWEAYQTDPNRLGAVWALLEWEGTQGKLQSLQRMESLAQELADAGLGQAAAEMLRSIKRVERIVSGPEPADQAPEAKQRRWDEWVQQVEEEISLMDPELARQCRDRVAKLRDKIFSNPEREGKERRLTVCRPRYGPH